jgi:hypothetical protein
VWSIENYRGSTKPCRLTYFCFSVPKK